MDTRVRVSERRPHAKGMCIVLAVLLLPFGCPGRADTEPGVLAPYRERIGVAVGRGIEFLAGEQAENGAFPRDAVGQNTGIIGLVGMAFLAAGHTPEPSSYGRNITRCIDYIITHQQPDGLLWYDASSDMKGAMYSHGICTLFLSEVSGMVDRERQQKIDVAIPKALHLILKAQSVSKEPIHRGGWRYSPGSTDSDLSLSSWCLMALRSAKLNGAQIPADAIDAAVQYVHQMRAGNSGYFLYCGRGGVR